MGIGEALITALDEKGIPTPLAHTYLISPESRMDVLSAAEIDHLVSTSRMVAKYNQSIDKESAYEILMKRMNGEEVSSVEQPAEPVSKPVEPSVFETILSSSMAQTFGKTLMREGAKAIIGMLGLKATTKKKK